MIENLSDMAAHCAARAVALQGGDAPVVLEHDFVKECLDANERGDGCMYASLHKDFFRYNVTPKDGEWLVWSGNVWNVDNTRRSLASVESCALQYQAAADELTAQIERNEVDVTDKTGPEFWKVGMRKKYLDRAARLRTESGVKKTLFWAPIVHEPMTCEEKDLNRHPMLLPVKNGVIDMRTGALTYGRPDDMLTMALDIDYDPHADYAPFQRFLDEITCDPAVSAFIKRSFGYAATGLTSEQFIWVFVGPGRNGKGVLFNLITRILGPYYHEINKGMILEQRNVPSPSSTSEHLRSLKGKRLVVGAETNKHEKIDGAAVKGLTGTNNIMCRGNFQSEVVFAPSHSLFLQTNNIPPGLTREFSLVQRLLVVDLPLMFVSDIEAEKKKWPGMAASFRLKDPEMEKKLSECLPGILRWLVEGCLEWQQIGLAPPSSILKGVDALARAEDYIGQFYQDCLEYDPDDRGPLDDPRYNREKLPCTAMYDAFRWWWAINMDSREQRTPGMKSVNSAIREMGFTVEKKSGKTWIYNHKIKLDVCHDVAEYVKNHAKS